MIAKDALERLRKREVPLLYAHRGASAGALENTMPAFEGAVRAGADGIELDVRASRDGVVVVFHDRTLERLAPGRTDTVSALTAATLAQVELKGGAKIPTLDEVLDLLAPTSLLLNVEIKGDGGRRFRLANLVSGTLRRRSPTDRARVLISSFRPEVLLWLRGLSALDGQPEPPLAFLSDAENTGPRRARMLETLGQFPLVHPHFRLVDAGSMRAWRALGRVVNVWTVDAPEELRRLAALGVDGLITNDPAGSRAILAGQQSASPDCGPGGKGL